MKDMEDNREEIVTEDSQQAPDSVDTGNEAENVDTGYEIDDVYTGNEAESVDTGNEIEDVSTGIAAENVDTGNEIEDVSTGIEVEDIEGKDSESAGENGKWKMNVIVEWVIIIAVALAAALFINFVIIINSVVPSGSMETTIMTNSRMMGLRVTYWFSDPQRGDIIVFKYPDDPSENFVKRVIGLPGERVEIIEGTTYINGEALDEPYLKEKPLPRNFGPYDVPEGHYFVMGDNRNNSNDARFWKNTYVPRSSVLGKALFVYWPLNRIGALK